MSNRTGLAALVRAQFQPRASLRQPVSFGLMARRAADTHGRIPIYLDRPLMADPRQRTEIDYVVFAELVEQVSGALKAAGVKHGDRVAIVVQPGFDNIVLSWAAARIGAIPALLSAGLDGAIMEVLLQRLDAPFAITDQATVEASGLPPQRWSELTGKLIGSVEGGIPLDELTGGPVPPEEPRVDGQVALITHTSSTTGISKLVENAVRNVWYPASIEALAPFGHSRAELAAYDISLVHVRGAITMMAAFARGDSLLVLGSPDDETVVDLFCKYRPTGIEAHPNTFVRWERLADDPRQPLANVRIFFNTFDAAHPRTIKCMLNASKRRLPLWFQVYGQTEIPGISIRIYTRGSAARVIRRGTRSRSLGIAIPGVKIRIVDEQNRPVRRGRPGKIQVASPALSLDFVAQPDKYRERRDGKWMDSGDWGRKNWWGSVEILDRQADRIEGVESCLWLEDVLMDRLPDAEEVVVVPDRHGRPVAAICMRDGKPLDREAWRVAAAGLPDLGEPFEIAEGDLKRTATAKARRYLLTELISARRDGDGDGANGNVITPEVVLREGA